MLFLAGCQATRQATMPIDSANQVKVYTANQTLPKRYKILGRVKTKNSRCVVTHEYSEQEIKQKLMNKAAHLGGNGVIIIHSDAKQTTANVILSK